MLIHSIFSVQQDACLTDEPSTSSNTPAPYPSAIDNNVDATPPKLTLESSQPTLTGNAELQSDNYQSCPVTTQNAEIQVDTKQPSPIVDRDDSSSSSVETCEEENASENVDSSVFPQNVSFNVSSSNDDELEDDVLPEVI